MFGTISDEREVNVPASEAWKVYGSLKLAEIAEQSLPDSIRKIDVLQGDGGVGTIVQVILRSGTHGITSFKEKYIVLDDLKMVKVKEVIEGGYLDLGFTCYRHRFEVIEKEDKNWCITKSTVEYEVKEEFVANASTVSIQPLITIMKFAADYLINNHNKKINI